MISASVLPAADLHPDLAAQVDGEVGARVGERLVLADQAAQLVGEPIRRCSTRFVVGERRGLARLRERVPTARHATSASSRRSRRAPVAAAPHFCSSRTSGRIFFSSTSGVTGPICL